MGQAPLISVIIPAYNAGSFIHATLASVLSQTHANLEVLVVDDGSQDQTPELVRAIAAQDNRVQLLQQPNLGVAAARNLGIQHAQGDYIAPLDADDIWYPQKLEKQVRCLQEAGPKVGLVYAWSVHIDAEGRLTGGVNTCFWEGNVCLAMVYRNFLGHASAPLIRSVCFDRVGGYCSQLKALNAQGCEDRDLYLRIAEHYQFRVVPEFLIGYRQLPSSMSNNDTAMARSHHLVWQAAQQRRPEIPAAVYRCSNSNFYIYLAQQTSRCGRHHRALGWLAQALSLDPAILLRHQLYTLFIRSLIKLLAQPLTRLFWPDHAAWLAFKQQRGLVRQSGLTVSQLERWMPLREKLLWKQYERLRLQRWQQRTMVSQSAPLVPQ